jgi:hypothetical protein
MAQFRVEFVLDEASGKYLAELYNPDNQQEIMVRTEALYDSQAAAVLGLVQLFKDAILQFPKPGERPARVIRAPKAKKAAKRPAKAKTAKKAKKATKAKKAQKKASGRKRGRKHN